QIRRPNSYIVSLQEEYKSWAFTEEQAPLYKGLWRSEVFKVPAHHPLDIEIGTGNGLFFAHQASSHPERCLLGIERKFKPLVQTIRRTLRSGATNARVVRYDAEVPWDLLAPEEINNVFIYFPDPWPKTRWHKNRLIQNDYLERLHVLQRPGSYLEFKTDHAHYFEQALEVFHNSQYDVCGYTYDLHRSEYAEKNFVTHFESIFLRKSQPIYFALLQKSAD
ncbi:MAG: tRNA (guanosine(46)-N7)-methyltransferase TrmB, partial [Bdellovibrionales bacterium]|nr:tRNA (guanosine(46)-N7)-methyltransferase TrmB [Bdellovibrionales bacterium]